MQLPFRKLEWPQGVASRPVALSGVLAAIGLFASSCTHDFSEFDVSGVATSSETGGAAQGAAGGAVNDGSVGSGGTGGNPSGGGTTSTGGLGGGTGGLGGTGGTATGGAAGSGGATGGAAGSGGATGGAAGSGGATGGTAGSGGATGGAGGRGGSGTCDAVFGTVPGYTLCTENATTCRFAYITPGRSMCQTLCAAPGGTCVSAENGDPGLCAVLGPAMCTSQFTDAICLCSKP